MSTERLYTTRREFLSGGIGLLSASATLPVFLGYTVRALASADTQPAHRRDDHTILVVLQLAGGNDGLNTVIPYEVDLYYKFRRQLGIPKKDVLPLKNGVGLHPAATGLKELFDRGHMAIVQGVGYPNPNRSHFTAMDIWHTADPELRKHDGWLGRYFDACCRGDDPGPEPIQGIALMKEAPAAMQGARFMPLALESPDALTWRAGRRDAAAAQVFRQLNNAEGAAPSGQSQLASYLQRAALEAQLGADEIRGAATASATGARGKRAGGEPLNAQLQLIARLIAADLPTRVYYVSLGGFDTHAGQLGRQQQLLRQLGEAVKNFLDTLAEDGLAERVLVMTFSEFGRRVEENASGGTDHGEAAPMFLFGGRVLAGVHEPHPDLSKLHRGDLAFGVDFRRVYATVLRDWLKLPAEKVLGSGFGALKLLRS